MKLVMDTDPGVDDAIAIALAHALPGLELIGLTTVFGNTHTHQSSRNARFLLSMLGSDAVVCEGATLPHGAVSYEPSAHVHGPEGFGNLTDIHETGRNDPRTAPEYLSEMARQHQDELVVCAIGPLTNIADTLAHDPEFASKVGKLVIMGGAYGHPGNITPHAEANIFHDPVAADLVFHSDLDIVMVGLDVTQQTLLQQADFDELARHAPQVGGFLASITPFYLDFYRNVVGIDGCPMHDAAAVLACLHPDAFGYEQAGLTVPKTGDKVGATLRQDARKPVSIATEIDVERAMRVLTSTLAELH